MLEAVVATIEQIYRCQISAADREMWGEGLVPCFSRGDDVDQTYRPGVGASGCWLRYEEPVPFFLEDDVGETCWR